MIPYLINQVGTLGSFMDSLISHLLTPGAIAVIPTDTVYGAVARAHDPKAVQRLYELKHRENKPGTLVAASIDQLVELGIKRRYLTPVKEFWPGAVSVIIPCGPELTYLHQGKNSLAVRIPDDERLLAILTETGPLVTSSANQPRETPATTITEARRYFSDAVEWYEDGGTINRESSTVIQMVDDEIAVIRQGVVKIDERSQY